MPKDKPDTEIQPDPTAEQQPAAEPAPAPPPQAPKPKPGAADYDWAADYGTADLYSHTFPSGTVVALKPFASIYSKTWLYKIRTLQTDVDIEFAAIDRGASDTARAVLRDLDDTDGDPIDELFKAWAASATEGLTPGESSG
jgi:hypothetical protein